MPFTVQDFEKWKFDNNAVHFNGGSTFFGYGHRCVDQPRLLVIDKYFRSDRSHVRSFVVDGKTTCKTLYEALTALSVPPVLTQEEQQLLDTIPPGKEWAPIEKRGPYLMLKEMDLIEWGPLLRSCRRRQA